MSVKLLEKSSALSVPLEEVKAYLRLSHGLDDLFLHRMIHLATQWIEEATGKSLLTKTWAYTHDNNTLILPHPPIQEILDVRTKRRILKPGQYSVTPHRSTTKVEVPFHWSKRIFTVTYRAGFGDDASQVPLALQQAVLTTVAYLYENRGVPTEGRMPFSQVQPWIQYYRTFELE